MPWSLSPAQLEEAAFAVRLERAAELAYLQEIADAHNLSLHQAELKVRKRERDRARYRRQVEAGQVRRWVGQEPLTPAERGRVSFDRSQ